MGIDFDDIDIYEEAADILMIGDDERAEKIIDNWIAIQPEPFRQAILRRTGWDLVNSLVRYLGRLN